MKNTNSCIEYWVIGCVLTVLEYTMYMYIRKRLQNVVPSLQLGPSSPLCAAHYCPWKVPLGKGQYNLTYCFVLIRLKENWCLVYLSLQQLLAGLSVTVQLRDKRTIHTQTNVHSHLTHNSWAGEMLLHTYSNRLGPHVFFGALFFVIHCQKFCETLFTQNKRHSSEWKLKEMLISMKLNRSLMLFTASSCKLDIDKKVWLNALLARARFGPSQNIHVGHGKHS